VKHEGLKCSRKKGWKRSDRVAF